MNQDVNGNRKLLWKEVSKVNTGKVNSNRIKDGNGRLVLEEGEVQREGKLKNGKGAGKDEVTGEMIKGGGNRVVDWIWRLCIRLLSVVLCRKTGDLLLSVRFMKMGLV